MYFMRQLVILLLFFTVLIVDSPGQSIDKRSGNWIGALGTFDNPIYFRITGDSIQGYKADWSHPGAKAIDIPCKSVIIKGDSLFIEAGGIKASYRGRYLLDGAVIGEWEQNGKTSPLNLIRMIRSQTPHPPFPYRSDSVEYDNKEKTVHLGATLTRPIPDKKYPVAILITGSGQQDRDETLFEHRPFAVIAGSLTRRGIAVLRVDDRQKGKSTGDLHKATSSDFADDVLTSIHYLTTRPDIDTTRILLIGHSEGGFIAPIVYSRWPHLNGIISLAGTGVPGRLISLRQQTEPVKALGAAAYQAYYPFTEEKMKILEDNYDRPDSTTLSLLKSSYSRWKATLPDSIAIQLNAKNTTEAVFAFVEARQEMIPWIRYFYHTDPALFWRQVKCPVLVLNGAKDHQIYPEQNVPAIKKALQAGGNTHVTTHIFPDLNHLFQHCVSGEGYEYILLEETFSPEVLQMMSDWIAKIDKL